MRHEWGPRLSKRWLTRLGGGLLVIVLVGSMVPTVSGAAAVVPIAAGSDEITPGEHLKLLAKYGKNYLRRLPPEVVDRLSGGGKTLIQLAQNDKLVEDLAAQAQAARGRGPAQVQGARAARPGFANDVFAAEDLFSRMTGMTQSETSASWCGSNALIGYNDSGSFVATIFMALSPSASLSFNGWSQSTDAGRGYVDRGALIADPISADLEFRDLLGDPVIGCTSQQTFYYASLAIDTGVNASFARSGISVSRSDDGGTTFGAAIIAAGEDAELHFLDKPWMSVEPGPTAAQSDDVLHVSYTDFDLTGLTGACPNQGRTALEYVRSTDGGQTWSAPAVLDEACNNQGFVQGSQVEAGPGETAYVGWERYSPNAAVREIRLRGSTDLGATFGPTSVVTPVVPVGDGFSLQGNFRNFLDLQGLAVDQTTGARRGTVYLTFQDGSARQKPDPVGFCAGTATYCFADVYLTRSTDGGASWSAPVRINNDDIRLGIDQWFPAVDVDRSGAVWVTYHDRRRDERNLLIDTFVARSGNGGVSWTNTRATSDSFPPITGWQDVVVNPAYMGDYIAITADATGRFPGVITAWGDNALGDANVVQRKYEELR